MDISTEEKILIDKLVRAENRNEIMDIVKKLVPAATEFTAMLYADYSEYYNDYFVDEFMDIEKDEDRIKAVMKEYANVEKSWRENFLKLIPHIPLTDEDRLYRPKYIPMNAPELKNKYLENITISNQDWAEMRPEGKYVICAMRDNPELDWEAAEDFVISEIKKAVIDEKKSAEQKHESRHEEIMSEEEDIYFFSGRKHTT